MKASIGQIWVGLGLLVLSLTFADCAKPSASCSEKQTCPAGQICQEGTCVQEDLTKDAAALETDSEFVVDVPKERAKEKPKLESPPELQPEPTKELAKEPIPEKEASRELRLEPQSEEVKEVAPEPVMESNKESTNDGGEPGKSEFVPDSKSESIPEFGAEFGPEASQEAVSEPMPEPQPESQPEPQPEPQSESQPEPQPEPPAPKYLLPTWNDNPCQKLSSYKAGYASTIAAWEAEDKKSLAAPGGLVVVGSSSIRFWQTLQKEFTEWNITQRGFGGSRLIDVALRAEKLILVHKPRAVLLYAATNDIASGVAPTVVFEAYRCLVEKIQKGLGNIPIGFIGIAPNPARWANWSKSMQLNQAVQRLSNQWSGLDYIDIPTAFLKTGQPPSASLFVSDRLHLNTVGYTLWNAIIKPEVKAMVPIQSYTTPTGQPSQGERVLIDLGPGNSDDGNPTKSPDSNKQTWNNWHYVEGGVGLHPGSALALKTAKNKATPWRLITSGPFASNGLKNGGLKNPSATLLGRLAVGTATQDYFYVSNGKPGGFVITGLDPAKRYSFRMFASRDSIETRVTQYTLTGAAIATASLKTSGSKISSNGTGNFNDNNIATFQGVQPNVWGKVHLDIAVIQGAYGYLAALEIRVE